MNPMFSTQGDRRLSKWLKTSSATCTTLCLKGYAYRLKFSKLTGFPRDIHYAPPFYFCNIFFNHEFESKTVEKLQHIYDPTLN